jgi:hypothetical protein
VGPVMCPFFHNTPFQFDHWLAKCISLASTGHEPKLFVYKKKTQELQCVLGDCLMHSFLFHYKCVCVC